VLVVANPANTNALMLREHAPSIPPENITAMTRLDHNRALAQVRARSRAVCARARARRAVVLLCRTRRARASRGRARHLLLTARSARRCCCVRRCRVPQVALRAGVHVTEVKNVIIWGNHSSTQVRRRVRGGARAVLAVAAPSPSRCVQLAPRTGCGHQLGSGCGRRAPTTPLCPLPRAHACVCATPHPCSTPPPRAHTRARQYPDVNHGSVAGKPIREVLADSAAWLDGEFITEVQQRGAAIIKVR
jgi:hypothetical protein